MEEPWLCPENCHSKQHADFLTNIVLCNSLHDKEVAAFLSWKCNNFAALTNSAGRTLAQIAAGTGRLKLLRLLLSKCNNLNESDKKSGDSALHISLYHGMIHIAVRLIQLGCEFTLNSSFLTPLDLVMTDVYKTIKINKKYVNDVYVWGSNTNYNLGCGHNRERPLPELLDYFYKNRVSIVKARIEKFHSVYLDDCGNAWGCGLGIRAGLGSDTPILLPKKVFTEVAPVVAISSSEHHTLYLLETGVAYSCGFNTYSALGHFQNPQTIPVPKPVRGLPILKGVCAGSFHSVFYSDSALYTCGTNYGQLGHLDEKGSVIVVPKPVTAIKMTNTKYECVAASAGATVILNDMGSVYLLSNFRCTRITPRDWLLKGKMVRVIGGPANTQECELRVVLLTEDNNMFIYRAVNPELVQCTFTLKRDIYIFDIALTFAGCVITTTIGEGFYGVFTSEKPDELIELERIPHIYRGRSVAADYLGRNMAIVQISPLFDEKSGELSLPDLSDELFLNLESLAESATVDDSIHDLVIKIDEQLIPAHSFIVLYGNINYSMSKLIEKESNAKNDMVVLNKVPLKAFHTIFMWLYSMRCPFCYAPVGRNTCPGHMNELDRKEKSDLVLAANTLGVVNFVNALKGEDVPVPNFDRGLGYHDAVLEAEDGMRILAHKCILVARSEYFSAMLTHGWSEAEKKELKVPVCGRVLLTLIDFMYTSMTDLQRCDDIEFIIQVMVDADKLLLEGVITIATHRLLGLMNLRNVAEILHFSIRYHNPLLEAEAKGFILKNLPAILESRVLEGFSDEYLEDLSCSYSNSFLPSSRKLNSNLDPLQIAIVQSLSLSHPVNIDLELDVAKEESHAKRRKRGKKTSERTHKLSEGNSEQMFNVPTPKTEGSISKNEKESKTVGEQTKAESPRIESRIKPVSPQTNILPTPENLTPLVKLTEALQLEEFPDLNAKKQYKTSPKCTSTKFVKLSQRERRRLASVSSSDGNTPSPSDEISTSPRSPWAPIPPPDVTHESLPNTLRTIINEEKYEKEKVARLKNKPLALTQIEDRALKELEIFYSVASATEEKITIERLHSKTVAAAPVWPVNRKNISL